MPLCLYAFMPLCLYAFMPLCLYAFMPLCLYALVRCLIVDILNLNLSPNPFKFLYKCSNFLENRLLFGEILWIKWTHFW